MKRVYLLLLPALAVALVTSCSTKKNTATTRFWQSFTTRYNVYYNGHEAYKTACLEQEKGHQDNYTERLPVFPVAAEATQKMGKSQLETAVTKCEKAIQLHSIKKRPAIPAAQKMNAKRRAYLKRQEFNPFLKQAWLLMGKAQFHQGAFIEAASTFAYITRHYAQEPAVVAEARVWLARCYAQQDWYYDAEEALSKVGKKGRRTTTDSLSPRLSYERDASQADLLLRQGRTEEARPYLASAARHQRRKLQRARLYYLLGQVEQELGNAPAAYKAYQHCLRQSPPYVMAFHARIAQTEVVASTGKAAAMMKRLRRMARSANNADYLDQVYYAMGNICLTQRDTAAAVSAYEKGRAKSTRGGLEKGILLLRLGEVYWQQGRYDRAQSCYGEAIGLIDKTRADYEEVKHRSQVLDALVPYTSAVQLQDSLLQLSVMTEDDRNAAIDRTIAELRRKEAEERRQRADSLDNARRQGGSGQTTATAATTSAATTAATTAQTWYFYNPLYVSQGKQAFVKQWGQRKNEDNWRRSNLTVLATAGDDDTSYDDDADEAADTAAADSLSADSIGAPTVDAADDPHRRAYYLRQIPFTDEAKAAAHEVIQDGLYHAGLIEKDQLGDLPLAARTLERLHGTYPQYEHDADVLYQLFLIYSRRGDSTMADRSRDALAALHPDDEMARVITDPDYVYYARNGQAIEDSLYTATYAAYRAKDNATVARHYAVSSERFPNGANRPKFIFVHALSRLGTATPKEVAEELRALVERYPKSDVSEMAGMLVKGLESGRRPGSGVYDIGSLWSRRSAAANAAVDSVGRTRPLSAARNVPFLVIVAYPTGSRNDGKVLYDLAHFNFTGFMVRNFDLTPQRDAELTQWRITGFRSFDEAHVYASQLYAAPGMAARLEGARLILISADNAELLETTYSFDDYAAFYEKNFAPIVINPALPLDVDERPVEQHYEDEYTPEELRRQQERNTDSGHDDEDNDGEYYDTDGDTDDDGGEWYTPD